MIIRTEYCSQINHMMFFLYFPFYTKLPYIYKSMKSRSSDLVIIIFADIVKLQIKEQIAELKNVTHMYGFCYFSAL